MQSVLKHTSRGSQVQVIKSYKVKLDEEIPLLSFIADHSHHVKVVAKNISSILNYGKYQRSGCNKADSLQLKKYWGYMIKKNRNKILE